MDKTITNNSNEEFNPSQLTNNSNKEEKTSIDNLFSLIIRRKKFFIIALIISTSFTLIRTTREKIYNSIFKGEFSILVSDPIKQISSSSSLSGGITQAAANFIGSSSLDILRTSLAMFLMRSSFNSNLSRRGEGILFLFAAI